MKIMLHLLK